MDSYAKQIFAFYFIINLVKSMEFIDLNGEWMFENSFTVKNLSGKVPGGIYSDLMENKLINDIHYGKGDIETRWVAKENWTYSKHFKVDNINYSNINVVFDGVDTFSSIYLNGKLIGNTKNMFVQYVFDVKKQIKLGDNLLQVYFTSPILKANQIANNYGEAANLISHPFDGEYNVNYIRKMQCSFGWDWAPAFPSMGIWKPVRVEAFNQTILKELIINIISDSWRNVWYLNITVHLQNTKIEKINGTLLFRLKTNVGTIKNSHDVVPTKLSNGELIQNVVITVNMSTVHLWWPNGYGEQNLYELDVTYKSAKYISNKKIKIGFRTVEVMIRNLLNTSTESTYFYVMVNKVPIFIKGTTVLPLSILPEKSQDITRAKFLLESAKAAHINMIRVWGSGVYQSDEFYDLADQLGLLIWQDFMFACANYPIYDSFLKTVKNEVRYQVKRLQRHPSIALWAAVNDKEVALSHSWNPGTHRYYFKSANFITLYINTIEAEVLKIDKTRKIITSLPPNDLIFTPDGYTFRIKEQICGGDAYFYNYVDGSWDKNNYPIPMPRYPIRAEWRSYPSISTLKTATNITEDLLYDSDFLIHRKHFSESERDLYFSAQFQFNLAEEITSNFNTSFDFYTQILQALDVKEHTEQYRIWRNNINNMKQGFVMGFIYYQLNDVWAAPTWSSIDHQNKWKMLHYFAKNFNAPIIIAGILNQTNWHCSIYIVSDKLKNIENATAMISIYRWKSIELMYAKEYPTTIRANQSSLLTTIRLNNLMALANCGGKDRSTQKCFAVLSLYDQENGLIAPENFVLPTSLYEVKLKKASVKVVSVKQMEAPLQFRIELSTDEIALFVWLEVEGALGIFSENGFIMTRKTKIVYFRSEENILLIDVKNNLTVTHLKDSKRFSKE